MSGTAYAQTTAAAGSGEGLEEIVVTAERRVENVQKTAASVSVRQGDELLTQGKYSLASILEDIPGMTGGAALSVVTSACCGTDTAAAGLTIRGIQSNTGKGGSAVPTSSAAAIYVDGVYEGVGGGYDIDRVEVLRGPQGTLYGRSATSGVVAIHTRNPDLSDFGGNVAVELGNYALQHYTGALNVPILDNVLGVRVAANRYQRENYYGSVVSSRDSRTVIYNNSDIGDTKTTDAKVKLLYQLSEDLSILLGFALQDNVNHGTNSGDNNFRQYWAELNWNLGFGTLTYLPALRTWEQDVTTSGFRGTQPFDSFKLTPSDDFVTHELRLASNPDSKLIWQMGTLYYDNDLTNSTATYQSGGLVSASDVNKSTTAAGVFAESTYPIADAWRITAGLRYDYTKVKTFELSRTAAAEVPLDATRKFYNWTYKARLEHDLTPSNLLYASLSTGFSPGDIAMQQCDSNGIAIPCPYEFKAETLTAYEIGSKNRFLDDRLQLNGAAFYYDYVTQTAAVNTTPYDANYNRGQVTSSYFSTPVQAYGAELELLYQLTPADRLGFNVAWTNAYYVDKSPEFAQWVTQDKIGTYGSAPSNTSSAPAPLQASLSYDHVFTLPGGSSLSLHGDARYLSSRDGNLDATQLAAGGQLSWVRIDSQWLGDVSAMWSSPSDRYSVSGYVRNVADDRFISVVIATLQSDGFWFSQGQYDPRTYGVVFSAKF